MMIDAKRFRSLLSAEVPGHPNSMLHSIGMIATLGVVCLGWIPSSEAADSPADQKAAEFHRGIDTSHGLE